MGYTSVGPEVNRSMPRDMAAMQQIGGSGPLHNSPAGAGLRVEGLESLSPVIVEIGQQLREIDRLQEEITQKLSVVLSRPSPSSPDSQPEVSIPDCPLAQVFLVIHQQLIRLRHLHYELLSRIAL